MTGNTLSRRQRSILQDDKGAAKKLPSTRQIAYKCGLKIDYLGHYSIFSEATHAGHIELQTYLKFNVSNTAVEEFVYGPEDGEWIDWVTLQAAGYLIDCIEISARLFRIRTTRDFELSFKRILRRNDEMMQRFRNLFLEEESSKRGRLRRCRP
jgi:hypothetical protein